MKLNLGLAITLGLMSLASFGGVSHSPVLYSDSADITVSATQIKLTDARYFELATKVVESQIPGCQENGEQGPGACTQVTVLERTPVIQVNVEYADQMNQEEGNMKTNMNFNFDVADFSAEEVAALKAKRGLFGIQLYSKSWAAKHFTLSVTKEQRTIQIVDVRNSKICRVLENGETEPNCVETLVYKEAKTPVKALKISLK